VPVLQTKAVVEKENSGAVRAVVDNAASQQNVKRFPQSQGFETAVENQGADLFVVGRCAAAGQNQDSRIRPVSVSDLKKIMVMCASDRIGLQNLPAPDGHVAGLFKFKGGAHADKSSRIRRGCHTRAVPGSSQ
jgi:hypothetical protein